MSELNVKGQSSWIKHVDFMLIDVVCLALSFLGSFYLYMSKKTDFSDTWMQILLVLVLIDFMVTIFSCPYSGVLRQPGYVITINSFKMAFYIFVLVSVYFYGNKSGSQYSRVTIFLTVIFYGIITSVFKCGWKHVLLARRKRFGKKSLIKSMLLVSEKIPSQEFVESLQVGDVQEYEIKAIYLLEGNDGGIKEIAGVPVITAGAGYAEYALNNDIKAVYISSSKRYETGNSIQKLLDKDISVFFNIKDIVGMASDEQRISTVGIHKSLKLHAQSFSLRQLSYLKLKRLFDIIFSIIGLVITAICGVVLKLIYLAHGDKHPILYSHTRVGLNGKEFKVYKFRTMVPNADEVLEELLLDPARKAEWELNQKFDDDPRVTEAGKRMRKLSIDELPQFLNVLKGEMSLIGPRPLIPGELEKHEGLPLYNKIKPGISGWWACNGRSNIEYSERLELEYYYVRNVSFELDVMCVLRTIKCVVVKEGAK